MSIFKACDVRGHCPEELDAALAEAIGRAIGSELDGADCVVGGDVRSSTPGLKNALCRGLVSAGVDVSDLGIVPTPVAYWARRHLGTRGAAIVTASHNPPGYNGVKFMLNDRPVKPSGVQRIEQLVEAGEFRSGQGRTASRDVRGAYMGWLAERFAGTGGGLRVLVDAGNGTASTWAPPAFRDAGYEVRELFCTPDGSFPHRSPNPSTRDALTAAAARVRQAGADLAACFDGDGDRVVFLDEAGEFVDAEKALILYARDLLRQAPGAAVVYDLKCTRTVPAEIRKAGGRPVMERSGHAFIKRRLLEEEAVFAGEASGHFFFGALGGDDGLYAALRMGELIAGSGRSLRELLAGIPPYHISDDIRIRDLPDGAAAVVRHLREAFSDRPQDHTDGVRIEFDGGWALCRPSVTEPAVTLRVEGNSPERMEEIKKLVLSRIFRGG